MTTDEPSGADLTEDERAALHQVELGLEWLHRAHGHLVEFHHNTGHAMDHLAEAEPLLRECGYDELADAVRDRYLPHGVIDDDRWSYDVLESFQEGFLEEIEDFETEAREVVADGQRHAAERAQERTWKERAERERERRG